MKIFALTVALAVGCVFALATSTASAQGYGTGIHHHTGTGYLGASGHFDYGDMYNNHIRMHQGVSDAPSTVYNSGYRGLISPMRYTGQLNTAGHPTGILRPGMVLPDGAVVVSVGN
ncbi:hypothetical protein [Rubripirellula reticaptiva]|uniref:Uncharacterized protein n=1 Tax=Rubripirellula reticaptiva TaxID=2528013 RepID=A0A5C6F4U2_9BACT|nr:hypothetical protein [Rubripirellula reticaptiva]TWU56368.1 hypothetical protein Poly59_26720 [Rubripirellula reticaptiva]